jgi:hypothetical protein
MEYNFNENLKKIWLSKCDINIKDIAEEFLNKTEYISINKFNEYLLKSLKEMLDYFNNNNIIHLQFFNPENNINKSNYWVIKKIISFINNDDNNQKYIITINTNIKFFDSNYPIIIADDASYSGSQICNYIEDYIDIKKYKLFILIPFISKIAIKRISSYDNDIKFIEKNRYELKPLSELMIIEKINKLFDYYGTTNITHYPIYFNHKVADCYSSFPLIYSYGIIPNEKNKEIIKYCKMNMIPLKTRFDELDRIIILNNCNDIIINSSNFDIHNPIYPIPPYRN